jgi:hypothetical protein
MHYSIRFNKSRGMAGRGTPDHVWRVFENNRKEYLFKNIKINVPSYSEKDLADWNIACDGVLTIDRETSTAIIDQQKNGFSVDANGRE